MVEWWSRWTNTQPPGFGLLYVQIYYVILLITGGGAEFIYNLYTLYHIHHDGRVVKPSNSHSQQPPRFGLLYVQIINNATSKKKQKYYVILLLGLMYWWHVTSNTNDVRASNIPTLCLLLSSSSLPLLFLLPLLSKVDALMACYKQHKWCEGE